MNPTFPNLFQSWDDIRFFSRLEAYGVQKDCIGGAEVPMQSRLISAVFSVNN